MNALKTMNEHSMKILHLSIIWLGVFLSLPASARDWSEIVRSGTLLVGTTGDYPPLTLRDRQGQYQGFAIDMAESLSSYLSLVSGKTIRVEFIRTHWPDLHSDLNLDRFDIAMGGITRTEDRDKQFLLSDNVIPSGKVVLIQNNLATPFKGLNNQTLLDKLNTSDLHLVINPGGTNQRFAMQYLPSMRFTMAVDNREPFLMLRNRQADVMVTDLIEANHQLKQIPALTIINPDMFTWTISHKVYMMPKSSHTLLKEVNRWLKLTDIEKIKKNWF
ncbi:transporter substrate-binding domain-containing protein [Endozoicomonas lisbonensis]|uniref:Cyclohexadienyl dehydratase n=1 Tax=Endozoicomonas lisbonensis TaxID=3120522 RepID=A0ABV2SKS2_9GAMM